MIKKSLVALCALGLTAGAAAAQSQDPQTQEQNPQQQQQRQQQQQGNYVLSDNVIGAEIMTSDGEVITSVEQLVLSRDDGALKYAIADVGGFLDLGGREVAIPWSKLESRGPGQMLYSGTEDQLRTAPEFDEDEFMGLENVAEWEEKVQQVFGVERSAERAQVEGGEGVGRLSSPLFLSDALIGTSIENRTDEELGDVEQLIINTETGQAAYVVADVGGFLGVGEREVAVPWSALQFTGDEEIVLANAENLQNAPAFEQEAFMAMNEFEDWENEIEEFFQTATVEQ